MQATTTLPTIIVTASPSTMAVPDDLATLFAKNLTLAQSPPPPPPPSQDDKIVYISQHYTHTAHISSTPIPRPTSEPDLADLEHILRSHGVETAALTLPQVELFRRADDSQKARLVQLWTICPPSSSSHANHSITWSATSLEQEEMLARRRHDELQQQQQEAVVPEVAMSLDGTEVTPQLSNSLGSVQSAASGAWESSPAVVHAHSYMEPYMQSGYEELARREYESGGDSRKAALDPVYQGGMLDWERQQWMENQYGSFVGGWRDDEEML